LLQTKRGKRLLDINEEQQQEWTDKWKALANEKNNKMYTYEQFQWAMEAVHSRAFKGEYYTKTDGTSNNNEDDDYDDDGRNLITDLSSKLLPFAAISIGTLYSLRLDYELMSDGLAFALLFFASAPVLLQVINEFVFKRLDGDLDAVMLPFIDSANHKGDAKGCCLVEFDPLRGVFTVSIDKEDVEGKCIVKDEDNMMKRQLYISYGEKSDAELLLNYGFLENLPETDNTSSSVIAIDNNDNDDMRKLLAETFMKRGDDWPPPPSEA